MFLSRPAGRFLRFATPPGSSAGTGDRAALRHARPGVRRHRPDDGREIDSPLADHSANAQLRHNTLRKQLAKIEVQEECLIELAADGAMPLARTRTKLNKFALDRRSIEEGLARSGAELEVGAQLLRTARMLSHEPGALHERVSDDARSSINETFFECFYIEDHGLTSDAPLKAPFDELARGHASYQCLTRKAPSPAVGNGADQICPGLSLKPQPTSN